MNVAVFLVGVSVGGILCNIAWIIILKIIRRLG